jgi:periplasmic protein TonB
MPHDRLAIFEQSTLGTGWRLRWSLGPSIAVHVVLFMLLLRGRAPVFVAPASVLGGVHGTSVTHLYWASGSSVAAANTSDSSASKVRLAWEKRRQGIAKQEQRAQQSAVQSQAASAPPSPSAGSPYGSLSDGASEGVEVRPALPAVTTEPRVGPEDLQGVVEGNVVVEITIDESGRIVNKAVVQSMGPALDGKVLAALENWSFHPATRDGVPIPSKQDVVYHFKPRSG